MNLGASLAIRSSDDRRRSASRSRRGVRNLLVGVPFAPVARPVVLGSYELLDRIGEGGMAEVWRARARGAAGFEKIVVIKRVLPALMEKPGFADLLVREAKISARLSHPNIAQVF